MGWLSEIMGIKTVKYRLKYRIELNLANDGIDFIPISIRQRDRLLAIAEWQEWAGRAGGYCDMCESLERDGGHKDYCPYSDEWRKE